MTSAGRWWQHRWGQCRIDRHTLCVGHHQSIVWQLNVPSCASWLLLPQLALLRRLDRRLRLRLAAGEAHPSLVASAPATGLQDSGRQGPCCAHAVSDVLLLSPATAAATCPAADVRRCQELLLQLQPSAGAAAPQSIRWAADVADGVCGHLQVLLERRGFDPPS